MDFDQLSSLSGELTSLEDSVSALYASGDIDEANKISRSIRTIRECKK